MKIVCSLGTLQKAAVEVRNYKKKLQAKLNILVRKLAQEGLVVAKVAYDLAPYDGQKDVTVTTTKTQNGYKIVASGKAVLFIEFGSGSLHGYGHPYNAKYNMGPSTWSLGPYGKRHWDRPPWIFFNEETGEFQLSWGNAPAKGMVQAQDRIIQVVNRVAREVFGK